MIDSASQRTVDDQTANQDAAKIGQIAEKGIDDSVKILIEAIYALHLRHKPQIEISFKTADDAIQNTKTALELGAEEKDIRGMIDQHGATQIVKQRYPENVTAFQDSIIHEAQGQRLVEEQQENPAFKQAMKQVEAQKQQLQQKQGPSLSQ